MSSRFNMIGIRSNCSASTLCLCELAFGIACEDYGRMAKDPERVRELENRCEALGSRTHNSAASGRDVNALAAIDRLSDA